MGTGCGVARNVVLSSKAPWPKEANRQCVLPSQSSRIEKGLLSHLFPPSLSPFSLEGFREHPERKGPHGARGWDATEFNESKEGNKISLRGATMKGSPWAAKSQCPMIKGEFTQSTPLAAPQRERGRQVPPKLSLVGFMAKGAENKKGKGGKGESGGREQEALAMFSESPDGPLQSADTLCRRSGACSAPLKAMATISVVQSGMIFWVPGGPCLVCHQWL